MSHTLYMLTPMQNLPGRCDACGFVVLVPHHPAQSLKPCPKCDADVSIFPGAKHGDEERQVFEALSELVHTTVEPTTATLVLESLEGFEELSAATVLQIVSSRVPALAAPIAAVKSAAGAERIMPMLLTILRARSCVRTRSGFYVTSAALGVSAVATNGKKSGR